MYNNCVFLLYDFYELSKILFPSENFIISKRDRKEIYEEQIIREANNKINYMINHRVNCLRKNTERSTKLHGIKSERGREQ